MKRTLAVAALAGIVMVAGAQDVDESRVQEILYHVESRAREESNTMFDQGNYPKAIQSQRMRYELRTWDEELATDLIWMYGNIRDSGSALAYAIRFRETNPKSPDRGYPEAQLYNEWRMFARVPRVLEPDILMQPPPHRNTFTLLSAAYMRMGFYQDVVRVLDIALKAYPEEPAFLRNRSRALELISGN